jgi:soluble lytic murein transglycosylase-like protein
MSLSEIQPASRTPAFLPLQRPSNSGSGFSETLRAQIRAEVADLLASKGDVPAAATARNAALQQSLLTRTSARPVPTGEWADLTRSIGAKYLPQNVLDVFTKQIALESGNFNPDVVYGRTVSAAGAEGIAQLMPSSYPNVNRLDPTASLNAAAATMKDSLQHYGGDIAKALAAYNAGAGTVDGLVARLGSAWRQGLPPETQLYLSELLGGANA